MIARDRNADGNTTTGTGGLEQRVYAIQDANWNTTAIIAATGVPGVSAGTVINRFAYTPYGESQTLTASWATPPAGSTPAVPWAHLFQGLEFTDVTGLAYVRHRDYSATLGRFIELDPIGFSAGDNNWYRFVANGPTGKTDPSGLGPCEDQQSLAVRRAKALFDNAVAEANELRQSDLATVNETVAICFVAATAAYVATVAACGPAAPLCAALTSAAYLSAQAACVANGVSATNSANANHAIRLNRAAEMLRTLAELADEEYKNCKKKDDRCEGK
jgi:RHS repeat-associated protein